MPGSKLYSIKSNYSLKAAHVIIYNPAAFTVSQTHMGVRSKMLRSTYSASTRNPILLRINE